MPLAVAAALHAPPARTAFQSQTRSLAYVQHLEAPPNEVMPLLTPTGERAWAKGWNPRILHPTSGPEGEGTVFVTSGQGNPSAWWACTEFSAPLEGTPGRVTYVHFTPARDVTIINITLKAEGVDRTLAHIRYTWTGLSSKGNVFVNSCTPEEFEADMKEWETAFNNALKHRK